MKHFMNLSSNAYTLIDNEQKTVEMRLYDEKRRLLNINDVIIFKNIKNQNELKVKIIDLKVFSSFEELYKNYNKIALGYLENEEANPKDMLEYYLQEDIDKYGVIAIEIKKLYDFDIRVNNTFDLLLNFAKENMSEEGFKGIEDILKK